MIAYYSRSASRDFWTEHWGGESVAALLETAETSPLTDLVLAHTPAGARVLEAGCGMGQYVILLRRRGRRAVGVDWSDKPLAAARDVAPGTPLAAMDLRRLAFRDAVFDVYVSLGVVEHDAAGPDAILREARRVLPPGGVLVLSVPYVNAMRRLGSWWIQRHNRRVRRAGGEFYQFALSRREVAAIMERNGFRVLGATPYDPARLLRAAWRRIGRAASRSLPPAAGAPARGRVTPAASGASPGRSRARARAAARTVAKRLLYTRPALHALGHMILFAAVKR